MAGRPAFAQRRGWFEPLNLRRYAYDQQHPRKGRGRQRDKTRGRRQCVHSCGVYQVIEQVGHCESHPCHSDGAAQPDISHRPDREHSDSEMQEPDVGHEVWVEAC